jgi:hypothetical protein
LIGEEFQGDRTRDKLLAALRQELLGPSAPDEVLRQPPGTRYLVGMLAPRGTEIDPVEDESFAGDESEEGAEQEAIRVSASLDPSSIGISCVVDDTVEEIEIRASWGTYEKIEKATNEGGVEQLWQRTDVSRTISIPTKPIDDSESKSLGDDVSIEWMSQRLDDSLVISTFLLNTRAAPAGKRPPDELWLYQPKLALRGEGSPFRPRAGVRAEPDPDSDVASADLIYRERLEFATGHGVAADWEGNAGDNRANSVWTESVPATTVPIVEPSGSGDLPPLEMDALGDCDSDGLEALIEPLLSAYEAWIGDRAGEVSGLSQGDAVVAEGHLALAGRALERMRAGVQVMQDNPDALRAFNFANAAMAEQLRRTVLVRAGRRGEEAAAIKPAWRPFQIGFVLLCLPGIIDPSSDDGAIADLLWFPTGGGKTEAYLGLTAFTIAYRRLKRTTSSFDYMSGTAVLMRYTLRLLTIQQFGRALTLLCACERLRENDPELWGEERFTIGLWVGRSSTPNSYEESKEALEALRKGERPHEGSPYQVLYCPWCGTDIEASHYVSDDLCERTLVVCPNKECDFSSSRTELGLPVLTVDQEIYRHPPSLLLATVDKFAQMAWNGRIQALYGRVTRRCPRHGFLTDAEEHPQRHLPRNGELPVTTKSLKTPLAPPELIIQDELHLISGPLGTLVGIYETAVDGLCEQEVDGTVYRPKVVASTATIRRADRQIESLFARDAAVFPPLGLSAGDSFFAKEAPPEKKPGRLYVGVYAPGKSVKTALVRVYATMLSRALYEHESNPDAETDAYMTLVGYFNSLRELGGALRLVEDDVRARLRVLSRRGFGPRRTIYQFEELTGRRNSSEIPDILKRLDRTFMTREKGAYPTDVLLASNMISVGVDIDRLGLMVVSGQPKTSAEYIQATSRVGRARPGLVINVYNWSRPRDTSHYERFRHYHETFYRHVEATSVTPFSARARDRALAGVLSSYVRLNEAEMAANPSAANFESQDPAVLEILAAIAERAGRVTSRAEVQAETEAQLADLATEWARWAGDEKPLVYVGNRWKVDPERLALLRRMDDGNGGGIWPAATSLREVESEIEIVLEDEGP